MTPAPVSAEEGFFDLRTDPAGTPTDRKDLLL